MRGRRETETKRQDMGEYRGRDKEEGNLVRKTETQIGKQREIIRVCKGVGWWEGKEECAADN